MADGIRYTPVFDDLIAQDPQVGLFLALQLSKIIKGTFYAGAGSIIL